MLLLQAPPEGLQRAGDGAEDKKVESRVIRRTEMATLGKGGGPKEEHAYSAPRWHCTQVLPACLPAKRCHQLVPNAQHRLHDGKPICSFCGTTLHLLLHAEHHSQPGQHCDGGAKGNASWLTLATCTALPVPPRPLPHPTPTVPHPTLTPHS